MNLRFEPIALCLMAILLSTTEAHAYNPFGRGDKDSLAYINARTAKGELTTAELAVILLADPPITDLLEKSISISYDPSKYSFIAEKSGLLCELALNANCPPPTAQYGTFLISDLPMLDLQVGSPLPGSTLDINNDITQGVVSVNYKLASPLQIDGDIDRNWFAFYFEAKIPYNPFKTLVTFFDKPGNYDFVQQSSGCLLSTSDKCGSDVPVYGVNISQVPEPLTILGSATAMGFGAFFKRKLKPSKSTAKVS